ncbi:MAG: hypothetical protein KF819_38280 [Labilithrix sp.]|nr:hypothetical protein [Labilithrix sp.]
MLKLPDDARIEDRYEDGAPSIVTLRAPAIIDGIPCSAGDNWVNLRPDGRLLDATLSARCEIQGWALEAGDFVAFGEDGSIGILVMEPPRAFAGFDDVRHVLFDDVGRPEEITVGDATFDPEGRLLRRELSNHELIDGVPCASFCTFHPNGRLSGTSLSEPLEMPHGTIPAESVVTFADDGTLEAAMVAEACVLGGRSFPARSAVNFFESGPVLRWAPD